MKRFDLLSFRKDKKLTQVELADILQCKQSFISTLEKGKRPVPEDKLFLLESNFGDLSDYIISYNDDNTEEKEPEEINDTSAYINNNISNNIGYISVPSRLLDEITKLTDTIHSQQRTIEKLVNQKIIN